MATYVLLWASALHMPFSTFPFIISEPLYVLLLLHERLSWTLAPPVWVISTKPRCWNLFPRRWRSHCDLSASWSVLIKSGFKTNRSCRQMVAAAVGFQRARERKKKKRAGEITTAEIITASELSGLTSVIARQRSEEADLLRFSPLNEKRFIVVMGAAAFNGRYAAQRLKLTGWEWGGMPNGVVEDRSSPGHNSGLEADDSLHISVHNQPTNCITVRLLSVPEALRFKDTIRKNWPLVQLKTNMGLAG